MNSDKRLSNKQRKYIRRMINYLTSILTVLIVINSVSTGLIITEVLPPYVGLIAGPVTMILSLTVLTLLYVERKDKKRELE